jgi:hypothetical protein
VGVEEPFLVKPATARLTLATEVIMFGFRGGESAETVARKRDYMREAQQRWPFLTNFDASTIKNDIQLASMVRDRSGITLAQARSDVQTWMQGKQF